MGRAIGSHEPPDAPAPALWRPTMPPSCRLASARNFGSIDYSPSASRPASVIRTRTTSIGCRPACTVFGVAVAAPWLRARYSGTAGTWLAPRRGLMGGLACGFALANAGHDTRALQAAAVPAINYLRNNYNSRWRYLKSCEIIEWQPGRKPCDQNSFCSAPRSQFSVHARAPDSPKTLGI